MGETLMRQLNLLIATLLLAACGPNASAAPLAPHHLIPGGVYPDKGPDGNTIVLAAPDGLIVFDTGRHPDHSKAILDYSKSVGRPVAAIVNSHWHLDHTTGNMDLLAVFPKARIVASRAIEGEMFRTFITPQREAGKKALADGTAPEKQRPGMIRAQRFLDHPEYARPTDPVERSGPMRIAGRDLDVRLAPYAATEGDVWLVVPEERMVLAGDLVVDIVPFMDTACIEGWSKALADIAAVDFDTLIPGHGAPMTKPQFLQWKAAFDAFVDCGASAAPGSACVDRWMNDAAPFIDEAHRNYAREAAEYYLGSRLRAAPSERRRYCKS